MQKLRRNSVNNRGQLLRVIVDCVLISRLTHCSSCPIQSTRFEMKLKQHESVVYTIFALNMKYLWLCVTGMTRLTKILCSFFLFCFVSGVKLDLVDSCNHRFIVLEICSHICHSSSTCSPVTTCTQHSHIEAHWTYNSMFIYLSDCFLNWAGPTVRSRYFYYIKISGFHI